MKAIMGVIFGSILTYVFIQYGYAPPVIIQLPNKIKEVSENVIASTFIEDTQTSLEQRQKAIAILIKNDVKYFIEIDNAIGNRFSTEAIEKIVRRRVRILRNYNRAFEISFANGKNKAVRVRMEKIYGTTNVETLKEKIIVKRIRKDPLLYALLKKRFPGYSDMKLAQIILGDMNKSEKVKSLFKQ